MIFSDSLLSSLWNTVRLLFLIGITSPLVMAGNLVTNGGFTDRDGVTRPTPPITKPDRRIPGWTMAANTEWFIDTGATPPAEGMRPLRVEGSASAHLQMTQQIYLTAGKTYTLSVWVRHEGLEFLDDGNGDLQSGVMVTNWDWSNSIKVELTGEDGGDWVRESITFVAPPEVRVAGLVQPCQLRVFTPRKERGLLWVSGFQLEEGAEATSFRPISSLQMNDLDGRLAELSQKAEGALQTLKRHFEGAGDFQKKMVAIRQKLVNFRAVLKKESSPTPERWTQLETAGRALEAEARAMTSPAGWWSAPWEDLARRALPKPGEENQRTVRKTLAQNDYGALLLAFANFSDDSIAMEVSIGEPKAPFSTLSTMTGAIRAASVLQVSNVGQASSLRTMREYKPYPYHLTPLGNGNTVLFPGGETTQIWLDLSSKGLAPGEYRFPVRLVALDQDHSWEGEVILEVVALELPEKVPGNVIAYAGQPLMMKPFLPFASPSPFLNYTDQERLDLAREWLAAWKAMGFNRLMLTSQLVKPEFAPDGSLAEAIDFERFDATKRLFDTINTDYWGGYSLAKYNLPQEVSAEARQRLRSFFGAFLKHAREVGLHSGNYPLNMYDEPHGKTLSLLQQSTEVLRELDPEWRTISTVAGTTRARMEPLLPWVDIFVVRQRMGEMDLPPDVIAYLQSQGKEVWGYGCSGSLEYTHPYRYYRLMAWQAWSNGLKGYGIYMSMNEEQFERLGPKAASYTPLFFGKDGPVYGKGAKAFEQGGRDWSLFVTAEELARQAEGRGRTDDAKALRMLLAASVHNVLADEEDARLADAARTDLLLQAAKLSKKLSSAKKER